MTDENWLLFQKYERLEIPIDKIAEHIGISVEVLEKEVLNKFGIEYSELHQKKHNELIHHVFNLFLEYIEKTGIPLLEDFCQEQIINEEFINNNIEIFTPLLKLCETKRLATLKKGAVIRKLDCYTANRLIDDINKSRGENPPDNHFVVTFKK